MTITELAKEIIKKIKKSSRVYITGHKNLDLDALGAMTGMYLLAQKYKQQIYLIIDDKVNEESVNKALNNIKDELNIITSNEISLIDDKSLLIIVDTNKKHLLQNPDLLNRFKNMIIIDHHNEDENTIKVNDKYIFNEVSSTCEIITRIFEERNIVVDKKYTTLLLGGIVLDTNNFTVKTNKNTYRAAYYLTSNKADNNEVQYLLKQNFEQYIAREKMLSDVLIINKKYALSVGKKKDTYRREDLAKIADILLQFEEIEASFVVAQLDDNNIGISARSIKKVDVGNIMKRFNGGGNQSVAAATTNNTSLKEVSQELKDILKNM